MLLYFISLVIITTISTNEQLNLTLEDARFTVYEDEKEEIITFVSTLVCKGNQTKVKLSSNEAVNSSRLHIEHKHSQDKTIQTQTFPPQRRISTQCHCL